jgi:hypothetical protein
MCYTVIVIVSNPTVSHMHLVGFYYKNVKLCMTLVSTWVTSVKQI